MEEINWTCPDCGCEVMSCEDHEPNNCVRVLRATIARLTAENARLRDVLSKVAAYCEGNQHPGKTIYAAGCNEEKKEGG